MKKVKFLVILCISLITGLALLCSSCKEKGQCEEIKKPKNLKPIDWKNYNDVYTVYWNCFGYCGDRRDGESGDTVNVYGWRPNFYDLFCISAVPESKERPKEVIWVVWQSEDVYAKIAAADLTKKCFVRGALRLGCLYEMGGCSVVDVSIIVTNPDDIYFE